MSLLDVLAAGLPTVSTPPGEMRLATLRSTGITELAGRHRQEDAKRLVGARLWRFPQPGAQERALQGRAPNAWNAFQAGGPARFFAGAGRPKTNARLRAHVPAACDALVAEAEALAGGRCGILGYRGSVEVEVVESQEELIEGWVSPVCGQPQPSPQLRYSTHARLPLRVARWLLPARNSGEKPPAVWAAVDEGGRPGGWGSATHVWPRRHRQA